MNGVYCLIIAVREPFTTPIGALGNISFKAGLYVYVGSAQRGLAKRITRHRSTEKKPHWHIDYLLASEYARLIDVYAKEAGKEEECRIAGQLKKRWEPVKRFGCSDCRCRSHLFNASATGLPEELGLSRFDLPS